VVVDIRLIIVTGKTTLEVLQPNQIFHAAMVC
jgi:hypothetical protein